MGFATTSRGAVPQEDVDGVIGTIVPAPKVNISEPRGSVTGVARPSRGGL